MVPSPKLIFYVIFSKKVSFIFKNNFLMLHLWFVYQESWVCCWIRGQSSNLCSLIVILHQAVTKGNRFLFIGYNRLRCTFCPYICSLPSQLPDQFPGHKARFCHRPGVTSQDLATEEFILPSFLVRCLDLYWAKHHSHPAHVFLCIFSFFPLTSHWPSAFRTWKREPSSYWFNHWKRKKAESAICVARFRDQC